VLGLELTLDLGLAMVLSLAIEWKRISGQHFGIWTLKGRCAIVLSLGQELGRILIHLLER